jgi:NDP-sugar pyrophosphorylase family protein
MRAIILAGGKGTRLRPYTVTFPKPLVPLGGEMPVMEIIIRQLARQGVRHVTLAVNHLANLIQAFFGDGSKWGLRIAYSLEETPLSTIGPLTLLADLPENFLVLNGDVLCDLDMAAFYQAHCAAGNDITVSVCRREQFVNYGVLEYDGAGRITGFREKPSYAFDVSMGVYCINRKVVASLKPGAAYGFDNLMLDGIRNGLKMVAQPFNGYWLDIGRPEDYETANANFEEIKTRLGVR